jgi:excisionase family DNA binding protein
MRSRLTEVPRGRTDRLAELMAEIEGMAAGLTGPEVLDLIGRTGRLAAILQAHYAVLSAAPSPTAAGSDSPPYFDAAQAASYLGVSRSTVLRLEKAGKLPSCRPSEGTVRFDRRLLVDYMDRSTALSKSS